MDDKVETIYVDCETWDALMDLLDHPEKISHEGLRNLLSRAQRIKRGDDD